MSFSENVEVAETSYQMLFSLCSRRLEVVGARKNGRARGSVEVVSARKNWRARGSVSPSRARVLSCAHYFQAPAMQAKCYYMLEVLSFCDREAVTSFTKGNSANVSSEKL